jgi:hypothetical protein
MRDGTLGSRTAAALALMVFITVCVLIESTRTMSRMPLLFIVIGTTSSRMKDWQPR